MHVHLCGCVYATVGLCPDWEDWSPDDRTANATEAMEAAQEWLDIPQVDTGADLHTILGEFVSLAEEVLPTRHRTLTTLCLKKIPAFTLSVTL